MKNILSFLVLAFTIAVTCSLAIRGSKCVGDQQVLLLNIKESLVFDAPISPKLASWVSTTDCCSWLGITCNDVGHVIGLDISEESITGGIDNSSSLFHLQHLQRLNLAYNFFGDSGSRLIPTALGQLENLRYLNLSKNWYSGQIPIEITYLTRLVVLDISFNDQLKLESPDLHTLLQNLTDLTELHLDGAQLSPQGSNWGQIISSSLPNLKVLSLFGCGLSGPIHESLAKLQSLTKLQLSWNNIFGPVPEFFAKFSNLTFLSLRLCSLQGLFPKEIFQLPSLQHIDLLLNPDLHGCLPEFPENGSLRFLFLGYSSFSGSLPNSIGNLAMLSEVQMTGCNFTGPLPKSMANLTQLVFLDMSDNNFEGSVPSFSMAKNLMRIDLSSNGLTGDINSTNWRNLSNLFYLSFSHNMIVGSIPSSLFSLTSLNTFHLSDNQFSGKLPEISNDSSYSMQYLDLSINKFEGQIPLYIFSFLRLQTLDLSSNNFSESFTLDGFQQLTNLTDLYLSYNNIFLSYDATNFSYSSFPKFENLMLASGNLIEFPSFLGNQSQLSQLDLSDNQIHGEVPNWIWQHKDISLLNVSYNSFDSIASSVSNLTNLVILDLHSNKFQGQIPTVSSSKLWYLDYSRNCFNSSIPTAIGDTLLAAAFISLSSNNLHGIIPESICKAHILEVLDLYNNSLSGTVPHCLTAITTLAVLNLRRNNLTEVSMLSKNCSLETLDISENQIQSQFMKSLVHCTKLEVLNLGSNQITYRFPCFLKSTSTLRVLILRSNKFFGQIGCPETNGTWPVLQIIDVANNNFTGEIPAKALTTWQAMKTKQDHAPKLNHIQFQDVLDGRIYYQDRITVINKGINLELVKILTVFTLIDFSCNKFDGSIPKEIGELKSLNALNLSNNAFTGEIPASLSYLSQLESLDLSKNNLTGQIPPQLTVLTFLSFFNVSYNQLEGRIPSSNQFSTFSKDCFEGNKGLFGPPLMKDDIPGSSPPPSSNFHPNTKDQLVDWDLISVEIGIIFGFGLAVGSPLFCKKWRQWYYRAMDTIILRIFPGLEERLFA